MGGGEIGSRSVSASSLDEVVVNLDALRCRLTAHLAALTMLIGGVGAWHTLARVPFPYTICLLLLLMAVIGLAANRLAERAAGVARWMLVGGVAGLVLIGAMEQPLLLFASPVVIVAGGLLLPGSEVAVGLLTLAVGWWLGRGSAMDLPLPLLSGVVTVAIGCAWLAARILYTALQWIWDAQARSQALLLEARASRAELARILKSYELANHALRRAEQGLIEARRQAESAQRAKEQFAANVSHELRTPLNLILGFSEIMHTSPEVYGMPPWPATLRRDVAQVYQSSRHLLEMVDDILALSHFELAGYTLNREPTDLVALITGTVSIVEDLFRTSPVRLEVNLPPTLPCLEIDRTRVRQVLLNLLNNAFRFTQAGSVCVSAWEGEGEVIVCVRDTGPGIALQEQASIFDEFYQVDLSLRRSQQGSGLGLAICKRFVEMHDGRIWVESEEGKGAAFFFTLPTPELQQLSRVHLSTPLPAYSRATKPCVLLMETDAAVVNMVQRSLEEYEVVLVSDETDLVEQIRLHQPRAVLRNQRYDQHEQTERLRLALPRGIPLIDCPLPGQPRLIADQQVAGYLTKPVTAQQVLALLERYPQVQDILVVDDDRGFVQLVTRILQTSRRPLTVRHAYDGLEGLVAMHTRQPDLVLLDLRMPQMDGFAMLAQIRRQPEWNDLPVILLTATQAGESMADPYESELVVRCAGGLQTAEALRMVHALLPALRPRYVPARSTASEVKSQSANGATRPALGHG